VITIVGNAKLRKRWLWNFRSRRVIKLKIDSMESGNYALVQVVQALLRTRCNSSADHCGGGGSGSGGTLVDVLLANLIRDHMKRTRVRRYPKDLSS